MSRFAKWFTSRKGTILAGAIIGTLAALLVPLGNPGNMGICVSCFMSDIAAGVGLQQIPKPHHIRPEIIGFVLGAMMAALIFGEFKPRTGSAPLARFFLGLFSSIGALVFIGCPWRAYLRLAGGDWNAIAGIAGLIGGIALGTVLLRRGFDLGRSRPAPIAVGYLLPAIMVALLGIRIAAPNWRGAQLEGLADSISGRILGCATGLGSVHAPLAISLALGLIIGLLAQRTRFCTMAAVRDFILMRDAHLLGGLIALVLAAFVTNLLTGQFHPGFEGQPEAHTSFVWNAMAMVLTGLAVTLAGGCPGRQLFLTGEGDADAGVFVLGMLVGAAMAHNLEITSYASGPTPRGPASVLIGLACCLVIGLVFRETARE
ncbi:MAG: YedE-related selenium metabolism membrane protein [Chloroflexi bacterium]|nr:YedE-related selenium metabolism membrane protein [Chloroflexota bacterium]